MHGINRFVHATPFGAELHDGGVRFRIWAPDRDTASVAVDGDERVMTRHADGWFALDVPAAGAGTRYRFRFGDLLVPDPAARFAPEGVHGASVVVDPLAYEWHTAHWRGRPWHEISVYELHVGTFTPQGTYAAAVERLDHLVALGITAIELMPLAQPAGTRNWGYDGVLLFAPQYAYGEPDELKAFVDAAHARGLCVFLDVVYNHFGPEGNYLGAYASPFFTERHHTPWGAAINYDGDRSTVVREFFIQNALYWLHEYRFDGLRLDAVHEMRDDSPRHILDELAARVQAEMPHDCHIHLVLENDANQAHVLGRYDAQWNDDAHHAFHVLCTGESAGYYGDYVDDPVRRLGRALAEGFAYQGEPSRHRGGTSRGEPSASLPSTAFVDFLQNHDQVGNRALGERLTMLAPAEAVRACAAVFLLAPSIPLLFMGEEWAASTPFLFFSDFGPDLAQPVTDGRRREFAAWPAFSDPQARANIPDPQDPATMRASTLRWEERGANGHAAMLAHYRKLLALRAGVVVPRLEHGVNGDGFQVLAERALRVRWRCGDGSRLGVVANLGAEPAAVSYAFDGVAFYTLGEVPPRADSTVLAPWTVGWFITS